MFHTHITTIADTSDIANAVYDMVQKLLDVKHEELEEALRNVEQLNEQLYKAQDRIAELEDMLSKYHEGV
jgi:flagellar biosynthesis chaperone FliJ